MRLPTAENLPTVRTIFRDPIGRLVGIPYQMRPGQQPRDLVEGQRRIDESRLTARPGAVGPYAPGYNITGDWISLGYGGERDEHILGGYEQGLVRAYVAQLRALGHQLPGYTYEWITF